MWVTIRRLAPASCVSCDIAVAAVLEDEDLEQMSKHHDASLARRLPSLGLDSLFVALRPLQTSISNDTIRSVSSIITQQ